MADAIGDMIQFDTKAAEEQKTEQRADFSGNPADEADVFCLQH